MAQIVASIEIAIDPEGNYEVALHDAETSATELLNENHGSNGPVRVVFIDVTLTVPKSDVVKVTLPDQDTGTHVVEVRQ